MSPATTFRGSPDAKPPPVGQGWARRVDTARVDRQPTRPTTNGTREGSAKDADLDRAGHDARRSTTNCPPPRRRAGTMPGVSGRRELARLPPRPSGHGHPQIVPLDETARKSGEIANFDLAANLDHTQNEQYQTVTQRHDRLLTLPSPIHEHCTPASPKRREPRGFVSSSAIGLA